MTLLIVMEIEIVPSQVGTPTLRVNGVFVEDEIDPVLGAKSVLAPEQLKDVVHVVLFGVGLGYRIERLREMGAKSVLAYEPNMRIVELAKQTHPEVFENLHMFHDPSVIAGFIAEHTKPDETYILVVPPAYREVFPAEHDSLMRAMKESQGLTVLRQNTIRERSASLVESVLNNVPLLRGVSSALSLGKPLENTPAFIVAAGPSLDKNVDLLREAAKKGAIFAMNTSAPVLVKHGIPIDVIVSIEALDVSSNLAKAASQTRCLAIDVMAHEKLFEAQIPSRVAFFSAAPQFNALRHALNLPALIYGGSVATAALSLAHDWGANPIVLVGQDLAYTDLRAYATGTPYDDMRAVVEGPNLFFEGAPIKEEIYAKGGLKPQPRRKPWVKVPAWGGEGEVYTTHELSSFLRWFETTAWYHQGSRRFINATEGGARLSNFEEQTLASLLATLPDRTDTLDESLKHAEPLDPRAIREFCERTAKGARDVAREASTCLAKGSRTTDKDRNILKEKANRAPLVDAHAATALIKLQEIKDMPLAAREKAIYTAIRDSALKIAQLCSQAVSRT